MAHFAFPLGAVLDRKYRLEKPLGQGGMGAVFRATHLGTDRVVALKLIAPGLMDQQDFVARFQREARATGRLRHPNIVDLTDFGFAEVESQHVAYLVMEFLEGETLGKLLQRSPTPPIPFLVDLVQQVCSALQEAHDKGIVHRDLKPDNLWLEPDRRGGRKVKILDFGLAKLYDPKARAEGKPGLPIGDAETIAVERDATKALPPTGGPSFLLSETQVGTMLGTPAYMSPEQCRAVALDSRSDIYSLGVILYQMLSGRTPFQGDSLALINSHIQSDPPDLGALRPDLPSGMARLVMECLSKDPNRRPPSAEILGNAFEAHACTRAGQFQRGVSILVERWHDIWKLARPHAVGPFVLLMFALGLALWLEDRLSASERFAWFGPLYLAAVAWVFYAQGLLKGMVAPVVLVHTLAPHLPLSGIWERSFHDASRGLRRLVLLNILLAFSGAFLFIPLFRLLSHIPPGELTGSQKAVATVLAILITGCFFSLLAYSLRRKGGSLAGMAPCAMLVEGLTEQAVGPRMTALRKAAATRDPSESHHEESYLALSFLVLSVLVLLLGNLYLRRHGGAGGDQSFLAFNGLLACALYPGTFLLTLLDALVTNLDYFTLRQIAREPLREDFEKLRETMEPEWPEGQVHEST